MIKVIIIDDEHMARESIHILLDKYFEGQFDVVAKASSVVEGIKAINKFNPDLVFLDVQMPEQNGFDLFEAFDKIDFKVIFTTAHEEYARKAIKHQPFDYLLKPIDLQELRDTIYRLKSEITTNKDAILDRLDQLESKLNGKRMEIFNTQEGDYVVNFDEIIYCKGEGNYTEIIRTNGDKILVSKNLKKIEEILPADEFIRVHQSILVNRSQIDRYDKKLLNLHLKNGEKLSVSMRKLSNIFNGF
ncbi:LytR/AlgR family response regulator transcription factor [Belliella pelovolcani]|uniref:Two component transcriptional regulator, LytTR family n=1 Tax=Belliella pelovolcani TaxID=529505 RepID=A0A1N7KSD8_9BACT|nr:LytTR family DNA-binding domain-containing protein [Belliella pelovolcani]SIS64360.1 two component transcriptional regulator, LytTR family [Belliella pelovolcani]